MDNIDHNISMTASRGVAYAEKKGLIKEYSELVFKAFFSDLKDISDKKVLMNIAAEIELDEKFKDHLDDHSHDLVVENNSKELAQRWGY